MCWMANAYSIALLHIFFILRDNYMPPPDYSKMSTAELRTQCNRYGLSCRYANGNYLPDETLIDMLTQYSMSRPYQDQEHYLIPRKPDYYTISPLRRKQTDPLPPRPRRLAQDQLPPIPREPIYTVPVSPSRRRDPRDPLPPIPRRNPRDPLPSPPRFMRK